MSWIARPLALLAVALRVTAAVAAEDASNADSSLPAEAGAVVRDYATDGGRVAYRGTSVTRLDSATYAVVVDFGEKRDMLFLLIRRFVDDKGAAYWKASAVDPTSAALLGETYKPR
jgi:hypothetical protein